MNSIKITLIICVWALFSIHSNAQDQFTTYNNTYCGKKYVIFVSTKGNIFTLWINAMPNIDSNETGGIIVHEDNYYKFIDALKLAKIKYEDAVIAAKDKSVTNLNKTMRVFNIVDVYFKQDKMYMQGDVPLIYNFKVQEIDGKPEYLLFVNTGKLTASNNTTVHSNGCSLVFSSIAEIDKFIDQISAEKIDSFIVKNNSTGYIKKLRKLDGSWHSKAQSGLLSNMTLGIKIGYNTSFSTNNLTSGHISEYSLSSAKSNLSNGFNIGAYGRVDFNKFYIQPEFLYSTGQINYVFQFTDNHLQNVEFNKTATISTLDIPLLIGYKIGNSKNTNVRVFAGPKLRLNSGSSVEQTYFHTYGTTNATDLKIDITPVQFGLETGLGFDFSGFTFDVRYNRIRDIYHTQLNSHTIDNLMANTLVVSLGWKIFRPKK